MTVLQILPEMNVGGVERGTLDLSLRLSGLGHRVIVVSNGGALVPVLEQAGVRHITLPVHRKNLWVMHACVKELEKILAAEHVDIVHARSRVPGWIAWFACRRAGTDFVTTCHGYYSQNLFSHVMGWGKRVIVISGIIGRHMIDHFGVPPANIRLIPRSVNLDTFRFRPRPQGTSSFIVSLVGRLSPIKGQDHFLKAMARVIRQRPYIRARIIGDARHDKQAYKDMLLQLAKRLGIADKVEFMGNRQDIPALLAGSDCLVLSTVTQEAFGRVIIEAQAVGVPVVATRVGGIVDIVEHERTGLLVLPADPESMAAAILRLAQDRKLGDALAAEARLRVEQNYTLERMTDLTLAVYEEVRQSLNILVIKLGAVGDVILSAAAFRALRERFPKASIVCLTGPESAALLYGCPYLNEVVVYDYRGKAGGIAGFGDIVRRLRKFRFDTVVDLQNNTRSHLIAFACTPRSSYGYNNGKLGRLLTHGIPDSGPTLPPVQHQFRILEPLGIAWNDSIRLELWPRADDLRAADELLQGAWIDPGRHRIVGINIAASPRWTSKNWPIRAVADLCDRLAAENIRVLITGMDKDQPAVRQLMAAVRSKPSVFAGKTTLSVLAALIGRCHVYVSGDSAPLHIAAAMGVPAVALFGPTDPARHLPPGERIRVIRRDIACAPCYQPECRLKTTACLADIPVQEVYALIRELLA